MGAYLIGRVPPIVRRYRRTFNPMHYPDAQVENTGQFLFIPRDHLLLKANL